jgi:glutamyl-tRNA synthetase
MNGKVRVRFAPSPTGYLHVGSLRTALYNYLFARRHGGVFVLRIEDTDRSRYIPGAVEKLIEALHWTGLAYDEGPDAGGPHAPYFQSQRLAHYQAAVARLLETGAAYRCFCTPERLAQVRASGTDTRYDRTCLRLPDGEAAARAAAGTPHTVRLRVPDRETVVVEDRIRGRVEFESVTIDDQVLLKSDGFPTYHLANVVDDHEMAITHVIRGEEWLTSTPKHVLLYRFLGYEPPEFAHLPLLLNPDRSKLSKRQGDVAVEDYRAQGYFPEALVNFVSLLGWNPGDEREVFSLEELVQEFSLERVNKSGAVFNVEKLRWFNQEYLKRRPVETLAAEVRPHLPPGGSGLPEEKIRHIVELLRERVTFVHEMPAAAPYFFADPEAYDPATRAKRWKPESAALLQRLWMKLEALPRFGAEAIEAVLQAEAAAAGVKPADLIHPLRLAVSGVGQGPGLYEMLEVLGRESVARRVRRALEVLGTHAA